MGIFKKKEKMAEEKKGGEGVVFLDCDGVLVTKRAVLCDYNDDDETLFFDPDDVQLPIEKRCLENLRTLVDQGDCKGVVLSTTWRQFSDQTKFLTSALTAVGVCVLGVTPVLAAGSRGDEIVSWLQSNPHVRRYVALDDSNEHVESFKHHGIPFVQTSMDSGLESNLAMEAVQLLHK